MDHRRTWQHNSDRLAANDSVDKFCNFQSRIHRIFYASKFAAESIHLGCFPFAALGEAETIPGLAKQVADDYYHTQENQQGNEVLSSMHLKGVIRLQKEIVECKK